MHPLTQIKIERWHQSGVVAEVSSDEVSHIGSTVLRCWDEQACAHPLARDELEVL